MGGILPNQRRRGFRLNVVQVLPLVSMCVQLINSLPVQEVYTQASLDAQSSMEERDVLLCRGWWGRISISGIMLM